MSAAPGFPAAGQQRPETPPEQQEPRRAPAAEREHLEFKGGFSYEQGDYGTGEDSRAVYAPLAGDRRDLSGARGPRSAPHDEPGGQRGGNRPGASPGPRLQARTD